MKKKFVVGLDIGTTKVCAIVGTLNEYGKINILGFGKADSHGVKRGVVINIGQTVEAIKKAISSAEQHSGLEVGQVYVGIAGEHIRSMQKKLAITLNDSEEVISKEDVERLHKDVFKIVTTPGTEIIHVLPQEYSVDEHTGVMEPIGMGGLRLEGNFHIITGKTVAAKNIYRCVKAANYEAKNLILEPLASSASVLTEDEKEAGICLVDIGGGTTDIAIFKDGVIRHTAVIPFGGNIVTADIMKGCNLMKAQAEILKIKYGSALATEIKEDEIISITGLPGRAPREIRKKTLASIIQARMEEIMVIVRTEIKHSGLDKSLVGGVVVTGGGSQLQHCRQLIEFVTGLDAKIGFPGEKLASGMVEEVNSPMYSTAIGLVSLGLDELRLAEEENPTEEVYNGFDEDPVEGTTATPVEKGEKNYFSSFPDILIGIVKKWFETSINSEKY